MQSRVPRALCLSVALCIAFPPAAVLAADQSFLVHSDTQYEWFDDGRNPDPGPTLIAQTKAIASWLSLHPKGTPVLLNGDVTAYGHGDEWKFMLADLGHRLVPERYWGLGNHDYDNNIRQPDGSGCYNNGCARDSIYHLDAATKSWGLDSFDYRTRDDGLFRQHIGSLAYSKTIGDIKFIQLHNHYFYSVEFTSNVFPKTYTFKITQSLDWLEKELEKAKAAGKLVVINMHRPPMSYGEGTQAEKARARFAQLMRDHRVLAIFHGHTHSVGVGQMIGDTTNVFNSGASFRKTFMTADIDLGANALRVYQATGNKVAAQPLRTVELVKVFAPEVVVQPTPAGAEAVSFLFGDTRRDKPVGWIKVQLSGEPSPREGRPGERMAALQPMKDYTYVLTAYATRGGEELATFTGTFNSGYSNDPPTNLCLEEWHGDLKRLTLRWDRPRTFPTPAYSFVEGANVDSGATYRFRGPNDSNQASTRQTIFYALHGITDPMRVNYSVYYWSPSHGHTPAALLQGKDFFTGAACPP